MKNTKVGVRHYWAKTVDGEYGGLIQQFTIEFMVSALFIFITAYCYSHKPLKLFFVAFIVPTIMFSLAAITTLYYLIEEFRSRRKAESIDSDHSD